MENREGIESNQEEKIAQSLATVFQISAEKGECIEAEDLKKYPLEGRQLENAQTFLSKRNHRKEVIGKYRDIYPEASDLFEACFLQKPKGRVEAIYGNLTIHIRCYDVDDYIRAYSFGIVREGVENLNDEKKEWMAKTVASAISKTAIQELNGNRYITIENMQRNLLLSEPEQPETEKDLEARKLEYSERARLHEEQHALNRLFVPPEKEDWISALRDEILALYRGGRNKADRIYKDITKTSGVYEYYFRTNFQKEVDKEQHREDLKKWLEAITALEQKGYSSEEVLALLYWQPMENWQHVSTIIPSK